MMAASLMAKYTYLGMNERTVFGCDVGANMVRSMSSCQELVPGQLHGS